MTKVLRWVLVGIGALLLVLVLLVVGVVLARDRIATALVQKAVAKTGFGLELKSLHVALAPLGIEVAGLKLTNPPDFPEAGALEISQLKLTYDRSASTKEEIRLPEVTLDLPSVVVVRKADGEVNFQRFSKKSKGNPPAGGASEPPPQPTPAPQPAPEKKAERKVRIDHLNIRLGTVLIRTYVAGEKEPHEQRLEMNVDKKYTDVTNDSFKQIGNELLMEVMFKTSSEALVKGLMNVGNGTGASANDSAKQLQKQFKGLLNSFKQQQQPRQP
jgi:uncharacterized protein involved in outer membrane biogenesis